MKKELNGKLDASPASCPLKKCHLLNWMLVLGSNCPIFLHTVSSKSFFVKVLRVDAGSHFHFLDLFGCIGPF